MKSSDSVTANISEGFGRFFYKEAKQFGYYSRGSLFETKTWITKAKSRSLISNEEYETLSKEIKIIGIKLNNYINSIGKESNKSQVNEENIQYGNYSLSQDDTNDLS